MAEDDPLDELRDFVALLARSTAEVAGLADQIGNLGRALAESEETVDEAAAGLQAALGEGQARLETGLTQVLSDLHVLGGAAGGDAAPAVGAILSRCTDVADAVASDTAAAAERLRTGATHVEAAAARVQGESAGLNETVTAADEIEGALGDLTNAVSAIEGQLRSAVDRSDAAAEAMGTILESALPEVLASAFSGIGQALLDQFGDGTADDPFAAVEENAVALLHEADEASLALADHCLAAGPERLEGSPSRWSPTLDETQSVSRDAIATGANALRRSLEDLCGSLDEGLAVATAWAPLLPQLPRAREAAERIQELMESMNPI